MPHQTILRTASTVAAGLALALLTAGPALAQAPADTADAPDTSTANVEISDPDDLVSDSAEQTLRDETPKIDLPEQVSEVSYIVFDDIDDNLNDHLLNWSAENRPELVPDGTDKGDSWANGQLIVAVSMGARENGVYCGDDVCATLDLFEGPHLDRTLEDMKPGLGSDVAGIKTKAVRDGDSDDWTINGQKMWLTNGASANLVAVLVKTDLGHDSPHKNMTTFLIDKTEGFGETAQGVTVPGKIEKMGYKGVDTTELVLEGHKTTTGQILGGEPGKGFYQMMDGVEVGRVNVAARACGLARRAFELGISYAQQRETFGKKIAEHQGILFRLADMGTKVEAAHQMMVKAAKLKDRGERNDLEAGMAKYLAAEYCADVVEQSFRIHGGYGYSKEYEIERLYREAPMLLIGEGTAEIQKMIIGKALLKDYKLKG